MAAATVSATADDVIVVGGGVIGLSIAWKAAVGGCRVTVVDPSPGRGSTWAAAGMLAPVAEAHFGEEPLVALNLRAARAWPEFARQLEGASGRQVHYEEAGTLLVAADASDRASIDNLLRFQLELGLTARRLSGSECRSSEPLLAPGIGGGAEFAEDHQVDNRCVVDALLQACLGCGVSLVRDEVSAVGIDGNHVTGVTLGTGETRVAGQVVVATGCHSSRLGGVPDAVLPPVRPVKGLTLRLRADDGGPRLRRTVRGLVHGRPCYLVPRADGTVVVGATAEEKGFDLSVQVGRVGDLLDSARRLVPAIDEYELVETTAGLRPGSPDNAPIVGPTGISGLLLATGHYRHGVLLAPITAEWVAHLLCGVGGSRRLGSVPHGSAGPELATLFAHFGPDRFDHATPGNGAPGPKDRPESARTNG